MQEVEVVVKPLSHNPIARLCQKLYRGWLGIWYGFCEKRERLAAFIYKFFFFMVFSLGVTIWQYVVMTFLPYAFKGLNNGAWGFPETPLKSAGGIPYVLFGDASGLGYFIAFEIAVFTAQCINFPLQRNVTFKSHGNVYFQALWYFIGWILISVFTNALWGIFNCYLLFWEAPDALIGFVKTLLTGGISFVIFFFIFLLIFPDRQKQYKSAQKKYEKLIKKGTDAQQLSRYEERAKNAKTLYEKEYLRKQLIAADCLANSKAIAWDESVKKLNKMNGRHCPEEQLLPQRQLVERRYQAALTAAQKRKQLHEENCVQV